MLREANSTQFMTENRTNIAIKSWAGMVCKLKKSP